MSLEDIKRDGEGSWKEYRLLILDKLETLAEHQEAHKKEMSESTGKIYKALSEIKTDLATQKVKIGIIATIFGSLSGLVTAIIAWLKTTT
tara:strand:+ start:65 stop:334 length:270 start_codon:yes stop_codon:yes gene_type:complete